MSKSRSLMVLGLVLGVAIAGCNERRIGPINPHTSRFFEKEVGNDGTANVDVLFVIDDSGSMDEEQDSLRREIPLLVDALTNPPLNEDGVPRWNAVESLRIAIVTTDLGTSGAVASTSRVGTACAANDYLGKGGALVSACGSGPVLTFEAGGDAAAFSAAVGCVADVGITGCGLEQPLAAAVAALDQEDDFPRADALLAVVVLSDEEDCSLEDPVAFFGGDETGVAINQRCVREPGLLMPIDGLLAGLRAGRGDDQFLFAALVGLPEGLSGAAPADILASPEMAYDLTTENSLGLRPACENARGQAAPGRRYVELASQIDGALVSSICAESFQPAITELAARIGGRVNAVCATRSLTPDDNGAVQCEVRETLPEGMGCDALPSRSVYGIDEDGREVCVVTQAPRGEGTGWFYDTSDATCEAVTYTDDAVPPFGTVVRLECLVEVEIPTEDGPTG